MHVEKLKPKLGETCSRTSVVAERETHIPPDFPKSNPPATYFSLLSFHVSKLTLLVLHGVIAILKEAFSSWIGNKIDDLMSTGSAESQSTEVAGQPSNVLTASEGELSLNTPNDDSTIHSPEYKRPEISSEMASGKLVESSDTSVNVTSRSDEESSRPTLPPRPRKVSLLNEHKTSGSSLQVPKRSMRPQLPSQATTALSLTDIHTQSFPDGSRETYANSTRSTPSGGSFKIESPAGRHRGRYESEGDESASIISYAPTVGTVGDAESLLGDILGVGQQSPAWRLMSSQTEKADPFSFLSFRNEEPTADFNREFDELDGLDAQGDNEGILLS